LKLTGPELLAHHKNKSLSPAQKVKNAGYIKEDGNPAYTDYYIAIQKAELTLSISSSKVIQNIIENIENRTNYKRGNDEVFVSDDTVYVLYYDKLICYIKNGELIMGNNLIKSKSLKERLNRILMRFCGVNLFQKNKKWYIVEPGKGDIEYQDTMSIKLFS
jgi:hypothetical protein